MDAQELRRQWQWYTGNVRMHNSPFIRSTDIPARKWKKSKERDAFTGSQHRTFFEGRLVSGASDSLALGKLHYITSYPTGCWSVSVIIFN